MTQNIIYRVMGRDEWTALRDGGVYGGNADDQRDGFIHFSTAETLAGTLAKHYTARENLVVLAVSSRLLGDKLVYEPSRGGLLFPHLYDTLRLPAVMAVYDLPLGEDSVHVIPKLLGS